MTTTHATRRTPPPTAAARGRLAACAALDRRRELGLLAQEARSRWGPTRGRAIADRLSQMPVACRNVYLQAMRGQQTRKDLQAAVKAMCQLCMAWTDYRNQIANCTSPACPLHPHRPYQP